MTGPLLGQKYLCLISGHFTGKSWAFSAGKATPHPAEETAENGNFVDITPAIDAQSVTASYKISQHFGYLHLFWGMITPVHYCK